MQRGMFGTPDSMPCLTCGSRAAQESPVIISFLTDSGWTNVSSPADTCLKCACAHEKELSRLCRPGEYGWSWAYP